MVKKFFVVIFLMALSVIFYNLYSSFSGNDKLNRVASYYANNVEKDVGASNIVSAVVVTYRGLDTLGEVTILFLTAAIIAFLLRRSNRNYKDSRSIRESSELLDTASKLITPIVLLLGAYVFLNGHLTPGGGFQGGAIIASGVVLLIVDKPLRKINKKLLTIIESISGVAYVLLGITGIFLAGGFLDNKILGLGEFGTLLSAGAVPIIYIFIGLKVGTELSNILAEFQIAQEEEEK